MYSDRVDIYRRLEQLRGSRVIAYVTGDRPGLETQIYSDVLDLLADHLDTLESPRKISLVLYSRGGDTLTGWTIVNLVRQFCEEFEVIVPSRAQSAATLICLGADSVVMTKQATLGPIDPSVNSPLNPQVPGAPPQARVPVNVEDVAAYFELAKDQGIEGQEALTSVFIKLSETVNPLALGTVNRARGQIQRLADRLLRYHMADAEAIQRIVSVLSSESGSHDYTISRREARDELGLPIEKPNDELYSVIRGFHQSIRKDLVLSQRFDPNVELGADPEKAYSFTRAILESVTGGSDKYFSGGRLRRQQVQTPAGMMPGVVDERTFEGWKHEKPRA